MTEALQAAIDQAMQLPSAEQERLVLLVNEYVQQFGHVRQFETDMENPAYRAYVQKTVTAGQADIDAGHTMSGEQIREALKLQR